MPLAYAEIKAMLAEGMQLPVIVLQSDCVVQEQTPGASSILFKPVGRQHAMHARKGLSGDTVEQQTAVI